MRIFLIALLLTTAPVASASAQTTGPITAPSTQSTPPTQPQADAGREYQDAMDKMHRDMMAAKPMGDATQDFVRMMIPHHQGASDMARIIPRYSKDDKIRDMAEEIIDEQQEEIEDMQEWLSEQPVAATQTGTTQ